MRKRGKKLLAIMLAASMAIGQSGTWTPAQENVAEAIEGAASNAQTDDGLEILTEEEPTSDDSDSDTDLDTSDSSQDDTEDEPSSDEENGGGDTGDGNVPGDGNNNPGANTIIDPLDPSGGNQTDTSIPEETPSDGEGVFTAPDGDTVDPGENPNKETDSQGEDEQATTLTVTEINQKFATEDSVALSSNIVIKPNEQIEVPSGKTVSLNLKHHTITVATGRNNAPISVQGNLTIQDTEPSESDNSNSTDTENPNGSGGSEGEENPGESEEEESVEEKEEESEEQKEPEEEPEEKPGEPEEDSEEKLEESGEELKEETEITENEDQPQMDIPETDNLDAASATEGDTLAGVITGSDHGVFELAARANLTINGGQISGITGDSVIKISGANTTTLLTGGTFKNNGGDTIDGSIYHASYGENLSTLTISGTTKIENNTGKNGGVICAAAANINLEGEIVISDNTAKENGGVIYTSGNLEKNGTNNGVSVTIAGGTISGNVADNGGAIYATQHSIITMNNGAISGNTATNKGGGICAEENLNIAISGGTISGNNAKNGGGVYAYPNNTTDVRVSISGGEIKDNKATENGGGIYMNGNAKMQMSNGTVSQNTATNNGGGIYIENTELELSSGTVISSNRAEKNGGGIYTEGNSTLNMSAGIVENNTTNSADQNNAHGYWTGGGGICAAGSTKITLSGGEIKGNHVNNGGGGAGIRIMGGNSKFFMTAGTVSGNIVSDKENHNGAEGGGISVAEGYAELRKGTIEGNKAWTDSWGGGGVFCSDKAILKISNAQITANKADGFGGGIAGCSTGRIFVFESSNSAFYNNEALGKRLSGEESAKNADRVYAASNQVFMSNGFKDYFCALNSVVQKTMYGIKPGEGEYEGKSGWDGSVDGVKTATIDGIQKDSDEYYVASYMMGLTMPSEYNQAYNEKEYSLVIKNNEVRTHGGGILCNGYLVCGTPDSDLTEIKMGSQLELDLGKLLLNTDGTTATDVMEKLVEDSTENTDKRFEFGVYKVDTETGKEEEEPSFTGFADKDGKIVFNEMIPVKDEDSHIYDIREISGVKGIDKKAIVYDQRVYRIKFKAKKSKRSLTVDANTTLELCKYTVDQVDVEVSNDGKTEWKSVEALSYKVNDEAHPGVITIAGGTETFVNRLGGNPVSIKVEKNWSDGNEKHSTDVVTVELLANGAKTGKALVLNKDNQWSGSWTNLPSKGLDENNNVIDLKYSVSENYVSGYQASYSQTEETAKWIPVGSEELQAGQKYLIVTNNGNTALAWDKGNTDHNLTNTDQASVEEAKIKLDTEQVEYDAAKIPEEAVFTAVNKNDGESASGIKLKNNLSVVSYLLQENEKGTDSYLKLTGNGNYGSFVKNGESGLILKSGWSLSGEDWKIIYKDGKFNAVKSNDQQNTTEGIQDVKLYKLSADPDSKNYVITITNSPYTPSTPDTPSISTPTPTPSPSATPAPSATPTPSATLTPSTTPAPSETPSVTPPAEETPTPLPIPVNGSIVVTKNLKVNGTAVGADNATFYVALFEDAELTQRASAVKKLKFKNASASTVTFDDLEPGKTYYVSETDENGESILAGLLDDGTIYTSDFVNGNEVTVDGSNAVSFDNEFEDLPDGFYYSGNLKVTKVLLGADGNAKKSSDTFYAGIFADADHTKRSDKVSESIIPLSLNGASSASGEVEVYMASADEVVKLYVTEVDKNGTPIENVDKFNYDVTVENSNVTISKDATDARVTITNKEKAGQTPAGGSDNSSSGTGGDTPQSYSSGSSSVTPVKTGDNTPIMVMVLLLAASALIITTVVVRKRKNK